MELYLAVIVGGFAIAALFVFLEGALDQRVLSQMKRGDGPMMYTTSTGKTHFNINRYFRSPAGRAVLKEFRKV